MQNAQPRKHTLTEALTTHGYSRLCNCFRGVGLTALEQALIGDVLSRVVNGQVLTASKPKLAEDYATSVATINRCIASLKRREHIHVNTFCVEGGQRVSEISLGEKAIELLLEAGARPEIASQRAEVPISVVPAQAEKIVAAIPSVPTSTNMEDLIDEIFKQTTNNTSFNQSTTW